MYGGGEIQDVIWVVYASLSCIDLESYLPSKIRFGKFLHTRHTVMSNE